MARAVIDDQRSALVLGATGGIGGAIAAALIRRGWTVRALVRDRAAAVGGWRGGAAKPELIAGDAMVRDHVVAAACEGGAVSAIVHAVNPPGYRNWDKLVLPMLDNSIAAARAAGGARIVLPGTVYNYDPATTPEIDAETPQNARTRKGRIRIAMEERLMRAAPEVPALYRLPDLTPGGRFRIAAGTFGATEETDGIAVALGDFGPNFSGGLFVAQDGANLPAQNFKLVAWDDIVAALSKN